MTSALAITMGVIGFVLFAACVMYYVIDESRTGIRYRAHRKVLFPVIGIGWLLVAASIVTNAAAEGTLGDFASAPFTWIFAAAAVALVIMWILRFRKKKQQ
jgi:amino acid transporter